MIFTFFFKSLNLDLTWYTNLNERQNTEKSLKLFFVVTLRVKKCFVCCDKIVMFCSKKILYNAHFQCIAFYLSATTKLFCEWKNK